MNKILAAIVLSAVIVGFTNASTMALPSLSFDDYVKLSASKQMSADVKSKVKTILTTPVVDNSISSGAPSKQVIKAVNWNLEGGAQAHQVSALFLNGEKMMSLASSKVMQDRDKTIALQTQIKELQNPDIIVLTDVDQGRPESNYKNVPDEIANALGYNYVFGVEFIGTDPYILGVLPSESTQQTASIDKKRYKGLSGHAILSKYPISNARIIRLPAAYDWYNDEKEYIQDMKAMKEKKLPVTPEPTDIKIGGRIALSADITLPENVKVTVIAVETEERTQPKNRAVQVEYLLSQIKDISNPVVIAANLNTNNQDTSPNDLKRFVRKNLDGQNIAKSIAAKFVQNGNIISMATGAVNSSRVKNDPSSPSVPILANNKEKATFDLLRQFQFSDKEMFEIKREKVKGDESDYTSFLSSTNERDLNGFVSTYAQKGLIGHSEYKLDWFIVKPAEVLYPQNPKTLDMFAKSFENPISQHNPMVLELKISK